MKYDGNIKNERWEKELIVCNLREGNKKEYSTAVCIWYMDNKRDKNKEKGTTFLDFGGHGVWASF